MNAPPQPLDPSFADAIFDELASMEVLLDSDPLQYGPKRLQGKVALVRKKLSRCERIFLSLSQQHAFYKRGLRAANLILDMEKKHLLANDPEVRAGRAVSERDAIATGKLKKEVQAVSNCENAVAEIEAVIAVTKAKRSDLRDIQGRLRDQMRLCQEEIGLGARWGSKNPRSIELEPGQGVADGADVASVNAVIDVALSSMAEVMLEAEVNDSDPEEEQESSLSVAAADLGDDDETAEPFVAKADEPTGVQVFGGASDNVPSPEVPLVDEDEDYSLDENVKAQGSAVLPDTATPEALAGFFSTDLETIRQPTRREIEEEDALLDIDSILDGFDG